MSELLLNPTRVRPRDAGRLVSTAALALLLAGCTALGPDFVPPEREAPDNWSQWHSGDQPTASLNIDAASTAASDWWLEFDDPRLDRLQARLLGSNPDLQSAMLNFTRARLQQQIAAGQDLELNARGSVGRQRLSEYSPSMRMAEISAPGDAGRLISELAKPYSLYQAGFDASWEPDFWGRISRSIEAADAELNASAAELVQARLFLSAELARLYFQLNALTAQVGLLEQQVALSEEQLGLLEARRDAGVITDLEVERQLTALGELNAGLPPLRSRQAALQNAISQLLGERPGALAAMLEQPADTAKAAPLDVDFKLGLPSELAQRRPDIQRAEAKLHAATAQIGVARADLYPRITLSAGLQFESYQGGGFGEWASRQWNIGPGFYLPLFNQGRLKARVELTEVAQQQAAIQYRKTVLAAWQEIDDALTAYSAERERYRTLQQKQAGLERQLDLIFANREAGLVDASVELQARAALIGIERELADSLATLRIQRVAVYKAVGGGVACCF